MNNREKKQTGKNEPEGSVRPQQRNHHLYHYTPRKKKVEKVAEMLFEKSID